MSSPPRFRRCKMAQSRHERQRGGTTGMRRFSSGSIKMPTPTARFPSSCYAVTAANTSSITCPGTLGSNIGFDVALASMTNVLRQSPCTCVRTYFSLYRLHRLCRSPRQASLSNVKGNSYFSNKLLMCLPIPLTPTTTAPAR